MSKENDWILNAKREAANRFTDAETRKAEAAAASAKLEAERVASEKIKVEEARQILHEFYIPVFPYIQALKANGFDIFVARDFGERAASFEKHVSQEYFSDEEINAEAKSRGLNLEGFRGSVVKRSRKLKPYVTLNMRSIQGDEFHSSQPVWDEPKIEISIKYGQDKKGVTIQINACILTEIDFKIDHMHEGASYSRTYTGPGVYSQPDTESQQAACVTIAHFSNKQELGISHSEEIVYTPEEARVYLLNLLSTIVTKFEEIRLKELKKK